MAANRPFIIIVPGASQNPTHYGYFAHLLQLAGFPTTSALLPSIGATEKITVEDDAQYIRDKLVIPVLDHEELDAIVLFHSYSSLPGSAAIEGLSKSERVAAGKRTGVLAQIHISTLLVKGGDGTDIVGAFGGGYPPHIRPEPGTNLLRCDDRVPPLYSDIPTDLANVLAVSAMAQGMTSFKSPIPRATWDSNAYKGRIAYIRATKDATFPLQMQQTMIDGTGMEWIIKDIESAHSPQLSQPDKLVTIVLELAQTFERLE